MLVGLFRPVVSQSFFEPVADDDGLGVGNLSLERFKTFQARHDKVLGTVLFQQFRPHSSRVGSLSLIFKFQEWTQVYCIS